MTGDEVTLMNRKKINKSKKKAKLAEYRMPKTLLLSREEAEVRSVDLKRKRNILHMLNLCLRSFTGMLCLLELTRFFLTVTPVGSPFQGHFFCYGGSKAENRSKHEPVSREPVICLTG